MNDLLHQARPRYASLDIPVTRLALTLVVSKKRSAERMATHGHVDGTIAVAWFRRQLRRTGWRYVVAGDMQIDVDDTAGDLFVRNQVALRVSLRVLLPPAAPLEGVDYLEVPTDILAVPVAMPSSARLTSVGRPARTG